MSADPVDADVAAPRQAPQRAADPPAARATPTSSACRSTASTTPARSSSAPAPARPPPGSRSAPSRRRSSTRRSASGVVSHVVAHRRRWPCPTARRLPTPGRRRRRSTPTRCAASTRRRPRAMVAEIDAATKRRRHPRRRRRGARLRPAAGPRLARALGPPARRPPRRRAHGHPGDQGRRGRRRLRAPRAAAARVAHDEIVRGPDGGMRRAHRPRRRHRGRHVHRRGAARARGDEADLDRPAGAAHRRRRHRRGGRAPSTSAPTCARCRPPASSPRRWSPSCSPTPCWRSSAATAWPRPRRNVDGPTSTADPGAAVASGSSEPARRSLVGPPGRGQDDRRPRCSPSGSGVGVPRHRRRRRADDGPADRRHLRRGRRAGLPRARAPRPSLRRSPSTTASSPSAAERCSTRRPAAAARRRTRWSSCDVGARRRGPARRASTVPVRCSLGNVARPAGSRLMDAARPALRPRSRP